MTKNLQYDKTIPAIKVQQWMDEWNNVKWDAKSFRSKPEPCFYMFSIKASVLKALSGIYPRSTKTRSSATEDTGIQRRHEPERSEEICRFICYGYPWSTLNDKQRSSGQFEDLRKPGWLPTAIVVNILRPGDKRQDKKVAPDDLVTIETNEDNSIKINLPQSFTGDSWKAKNISPIEIIDGQHRLWAFEDPELKDDFQLPVVAFYGLDISWQAYLFYTINIKPKKINASLAFDLYPLLRTEDWLEKFEGHIIYRETRAQELVDLLWSHPQSPWHKRINMLGEPGTKGLMVSQAAWIRSLLATYIRSWEGPRIRIGGLFGAQVGSHKQVLPWSRTEQAAFLIVAGIYFKKAVENTKESWVKTLRQQKQMSLPSIINKEDLAFYGPNTLINQDQGVRAFLHVTNDLCYINADKLGLAKWEYSEDSTGGKDKEITVAVAALQKSNIGEFLKSISEKLALYDWRASDAPGLSEEEQLYKAAFRGGGGYKELRRHLLLHLKKQGGPDIDSAATEVLRLIGYK